MSEITIRTVYGPHPSRCYGLSLGIDPLLFPKKCPYNCIYCPIGKTAFKTVEPKIYVDVERVQKDVIEYYEREGCVFETVTIWGFGDPMLNYQTPVITRAVKELLTSLNCRVKVVLRTTGFNLGMEWARVVFDHVDEIVIPLDNPPSYWRQFNEPLDKLSLKSIVDMIRNLSLSAKSKIRFEINLFRIGDYSNASEDVLAELIGMIEKSRVSRVYVKTVNRPPQTRGVKPIRGKLFERVIDDLNNRGINALACRGGGLSLRTITSSEENVFNHIYRKPLSTDEILSIYGRKAIVLVENWVEQGFVEKINWDGRIYFKAKNLPILTRGVSVEHG